MNRVFVYGTLKYESCIMYKDFVSNCDYIKDDFFNGTLFNLGNFPAAIESDGKVHGKLFKIKNPEVLDRLDKYEGDSYDRKIIDINGVKSWCYIFNQPIENFKVIENGIY